jgi:hypothetical protein
MVFFSERSMDRILPWQLFVHPNIHHCLHLQQRQKINKTKWRNTKSQGTGAHVPTNSKIKTKVSSTYGNIAISSSLRIIRFYPQQPSTSVGSLFLPAGTSWEPTEVATDRRVWHRSQTRLGLTQGEAVYCNLHIWSARRFIGWPSSVSKIPKHSTDTQKVEISVLFLRLFNPFHLDFYLKKPITLCFR